MHVGPAEAQQIEHPIGCQCCRSEQLETHHSCLGEDLRVSEFIRGSFLVLRVPHQLNQR